MVQVQGLCSGHHNRIRHYRRVKRTVMHLHVSMLSPANPLPGMGGEVDSSCKQAISPMGGGLNWACATQIPRVSSTKWWMCQILTLILTGPTWWWGFDSTALNLPVGGEIEFWDDQNPTVPPIHTREGLVGLNIDIMYVRKSTEIDSRPAYFIFSTAMRECLTRDVDNSCFWLHMNRNHTTHVQ